MYNLEVQASKKNFSNRFGSKLKNVTILKVSMYTPACAAEAWVQFLLKLYKEIFVKK
jgi:hypothetical protein